MMNLEEMKIKNGGFNHDMKNYVLLQNAYLSDYRTVICFEATAVCTEDQPDDDGWVPCYNVRWDYTGDDNEEDLADCADWDNPADVTNTGEYNINDGRIV